MTSKAGTDILEAPRNTREEMTMTITREAFRELEGLYVNQMVSNRFELTEDERDNVRKINEYMAERLDELNVPWVIQNAVAFAGTKRDNWRRYNRDVISEIIHQYYGQ